MPSKLQRDVEAATRFFHKTLASFHTVSPRVITVDRNAASPKAFHERKAVGAVPTPCELRQRKYLNTLVEQDHRFLKRLVKPGMGFWSFEIAWSTFREYEVMHMIRKGQVQEIDKGEIVSVKQDSSQGCLEWQSKLNRTGTVSRAIPFANFLQHKQIEQLCQLRC
ncbi:hypothetical protein KSC_089940 [Ktedonobacter sp. SOSP1-52]|uniref:DDE-type integrase/transposase/recombinase n=1 Tax=Ktedonobacter sp. SOSP1-52 TaxID=2778366 RepID=UPI001916C6B9|nr:DDE-type integrase/transposase/recombinase [Ktedonobacter sp. SOSP1-52]GHO70102.1 hypothetical protein KSC_089940 [Ktedonobacter sp. SOSP1-52]